MTAMAPPDVLFVHSNFPGQFGFLASALSERGVRCAAISSPTGKPMTGIAHRTWQHQRGSTPGIFPDATRAEADFIRGQSAAQAAMQLRDLGLNPRVIIGHPGWGETLFLREVFPNARQILYGEFYYRTVGADVGFDPEFPEPSLAERFRVHAKNATMALALADADRIVSPTRFQAGLIPSIFQPRISVIHEGVDTGVVKPNAQASFDLSNGRVLDRTNRVITFINRRFEPLRGYHILMRALPAVLAALPDVEVLLIGADQAGGYGLSAPKGTTWGNHFLNEVRDRIDTSRVHFTGRVSYEQMLAALSISSAHVYYTYPFALSWSLLEAMASGCLVVTSDTAPVRDVVEHQVNGLALDFFDGDALARALIEACEHPDRFADYRVRARETIVERFDRKHVTLPAWLELIEREMAG
jgi:glycosyltransferase involved in cell wall biosynthesis